ncbi:SelB translation factor [Anaerohalosphaera lusitana]|uniref:SelB translation factor n=1 Tax=Anaerohalosphaera lusitana TaxID=1936003 RepID=A0A1U9NKF6_9BACT|nr:selenocysteine-specific translation elongation factor [Anaerohalosphaera lusitana]AQT68218.1 SelB translation factor [Anaerohalosphaera lusitana]
MSSSQINITLGTAGHIDHGKTALIKLLTGCETDRLKAEKDRGMSIELGFAPCTISDLEVGIVDVPGHENFIKTMVAGATGIDAVIFVIAADDGVMPQTREHLDILTILGVSHGIIALTKVDTVDDELRDLVADDVRNFITGTFLENAPILPVSSITGQGFDAFYGSLREMVSRVTPKPSDGIFRVPVENVFSVKGYGSVITGIPVAGSASIGDELIILPQDETGRIKAAQVYSKPAQKAQTGQCAAINVPQWDYKAISRGDVATVPGYFEPAHFYLAKMSLIPHVGHKLKTGSQLKLHTGTSEHTAKIYLMEDNTLQPGTETLVQFRLDTPLVAGPRDPFIVRSLTPPRTIGGGTILKPLTRRLKRSKPAVLENARSLARAIENDKTFVFYTVNDSPNHTATTEDIARTVKLRPQTVTAITDHLVSTGDLIRTADNTYMAAETESILRSNLLDTLKTYHAENPQSPGMTFDDLRNAVDLDPSLFKFMISRLTDAGRIEHRKGRAALSTHKVQFDTAQADLMNTIETIFLDRLFNPPGTDELLRTTKANTRDLTQALNTLAQHKKLVRIDSKITFHTAAVEKAKELLIADLQENGRFESVRFKYLLDTSRKYALPLLDFFDDIGLTRRDGNTRYLKNG